MNTGTLREGRRESHLNLLSTSGLRVRLEMTTNAMRILRGDTPGLRVSAGGGKLVVRGDGPTAAGGPLSLGGVIRVWSPRVSTFLVRPLRAP